MNLIWPQHLKGTELFRYIKANKAAIIDMKKSVIKCADAVIIAVTEEPPRSIAKGQYLFSNDEPNGILKRTIIANTYNWLDSHDDVHQNNLFAKSINDKGVKIPHLHDHIFQLDARVGMPISWNEKSIPWRDLGVNKDGSTMSLFLESNIMKSLNKSVYKAYLDGIIDQHSVKMQYVKMGMAINDPDYEDEYKEWVATFDKLGNPEKAIEQGYYFPQYEAKLFEGSAVLLGSNELTPTLGNKFEPLKGTQKDQPPKALDIAELVKSNYKLN